LYLIYLKEKNNHLHLNCAGKIIGQNQKKQK